MSGEVLIVESRHKRWMRWAASGGGAFVVVSAALLIADGKLWPTGFTTMALALVSINLWLQTRVRTMVTAGHVNVRREFRDRVIETADVTDVELPTRWSPVRLRLTSGETVELPHVRPDQADAVRQMVRARAPELAMRGRPCRATGPHARRVTPSPAEPRGA